MIVGIDLGTTNSLIAYFDGDHAKVIPNQSGRKSDSFGCKRG